MRRAHLDVQTFESILKAFAEDRPAKQAAQDFDASYTSCKTLYGRFRLHILEYGHDWQELPNLESDKHIYDEETVFGVQAADYKIVVSPAYPDEIKGNTDQITFDSLFDGQSRHLRIHTASKNRKDQLIDSFWDFTQRRTARLQGLAKQTLYLHLKENQFRFNLRDQDLYEILKKSLRLNPL